MEEEKPKEGEVSEEKEEIKESVSEEPELEVVDIPEKKENHPDLAEKKLETISKILDIGNEDSKLGNLEVVDLDKKKQADPKAESKPEEKKEEPKEEKKGSGKKFDFKKYKWLFVVGIVLIIILLMFSVKSQIEDLTGASVVDTEQEDVAEETHDDPVEEEQAEEVEEEKPVEKESLQDALKNRILNGIQITSDSNNKSDDEFDVGVAGQVADYLKDKVSDGGEGLFDKIKSSLSGLIE